MARIEELFADALRIEAADARDVIAGDWRSGVAGQTVDDSVAFGGWEGDPEDEAEVAQARIDLTSIEQVCGGQASGA